MVSASSFDLDYGSSILPAPAIKVIHSLLLILVLLLTIINIGDRMRTRKSRVYDVPEEEFIEIVKNSNSCAEAMRKIGYVCTTGNSHDVMKRRVSELHLDTSHWGPNTESAHLATRQSDEVYFAEHTPHSGTHIRERLIRYNMLEYKCSICGNRGEWNGQKLVLQIDHINGIHDDNRLENLRFLCPNCHSQTETFAGKNIK